MPRAMPDGPGKRHTLSSRLTPEVHTALREAAKLAGRSVSQEAEFRIERSFIDDSKSQDELKSNLVAKALLGDDLSAELVRSFITAIGAAMGYTGRHWRDDIYTRASVKSAIDAVRDRHFLANPLNVDPATINVERLERAAKTGVMLGKILVAAHLDPDVASWIEDMAKAEVPAAEVDMAAAEFSKLPPERQRAALNKMIGFDRK